MNLVQILHSLGMQNLHLFGVQILHEGGLDADFSCRPGCRDCTSAIMQKFHVGLRAGFAFWPTGKSCLMAWMQISSSGLNANFAGRNGVRLYNLGVQ